MDTEGFQDSETLLCDTAMVDPRIIHLFQPIEDTTPRVNPNVKNGLWVMMMCQYRFISYNKCTILMGDVDNGGGCVCMGAGGIWANLCIFPLNFAVSLKLL